MRDAKDWIHGAQLRLEAARLLFRNGLHADSLTRLYFAVFQAGKACVIDEGLTAKSHDGVGFQLRHTLNRASDAELLRSFRTDRESCDYKLLTPEASYVTSRMEEAVRFVEEIEELL